MELNLTHSTEEDSRKDYDVIIIGAGASGFSAAIYAVRSGLSAVILDKSVSGGLTAEAPLVENYLGFKAIPGTDLAREFSNHAAVYAPIREYTEVYRVRQSQNRFTVETNNGNYTGSAVIVATGTTHKHLNVPGEKEYFGKGLSYCSTCDGYLFKDRKVVVIGGGNSGAIAAISMSEYTKEMTILEFMPRYMCEDAYINTIKSRKIPYLMNNQVLEILGNGKKVTGVRYKNRDSGKEETVETDGVFVYVGLLPQTGFLKDSGVKLNDKGYVQVDLKGRTSVKGIYASGDVTGTEAQIATAVGDGCRASMTLYSDLLKEGKR
jgi:thioredoxin reductase (NADPH)